MLKVHQCNFVNFRGNGETAGSIGNKNKPVECPTCGQISFRSQPTEDTFTRQTKAESVPEKVV